MAISIEDVNILAEIIDQQLDKYSKIANTHKKYLNINTHSLKIVSSCTSLLMRVPNHCIRNKKEWKNIEKSFKSMN